MTAINCFELVFVLQVLSKDALRLKLIFDEQLGEWSQRHDNTVSYVVASDMQVTSRDWIGMYRVRESWC